MDRVDKTLTSVVTSQSASALPTFICKHVVMDKNWALEKSERYTSAAKFKVRCLWSIYSSQL